MTTSSSTLELILRHRIVAILRGCDPEHIEPVAAALYEGGIRLLEITTGSDAKMLPGLTADDKILTNIEILSINAIPKSLIVIGAGAVGVEFASIFRSIES